MERKKGVAVVWEQTEIFESDGRMWKTFSSISLEINFSKREARILKKWFVQNYVLEEKLC